MEYDWNIESILKSDVNDDVKHILKEILNKNVSKESLEIFKKSQNFEEFKEQFRESITIMGILNEDIRDLIFRNLTYFNLNSIKYFNQKRDDITPDVLLNFTTSLIDFINNDRISKSYQYILNNKKDHIRIKSFNEKEDMKYVYRGAVFKAKDNHDAFLNFYQKNDFYDPFLFTHEMGHFISPFLINKMNPLTSTFLTEVDSYYFELLASLHFALENNHEEFFNLILSRRVILIIENLYHLYLQSELILNNGLLDENKLNIPYEQKLNQSNINNLYSYSPLYAYSIIISFLIAYDLFLYTKSDMKKGIDNYISFLESDEIDLKSLLEMHHINFLNDDILNFKNLYEDIKRLNKRYE